MMRRLFERPGYALVLVLLLAAPAAAQRALPVEEPVDVSGTYASGSFEYHPRGVAAQSGTATLEVTGNRFTLTRADGPARSGGIHLFVMPERGNYTTGTIQFDGGPRISVRWHRKGEMLKLVQVRGERSLFRFCSRGLTRRQCLNRI